MPRKRTGLSSELDAVFHSLGLEAESGESGNAFWTMAQPIPSASTFRCSEAQPRPDYFVYSLLTSQDPLQTVNAEAVTMSASLLGCDMVRRLDIILSGKDRIPRLYMNRSIRTRAT